MYPSLKAVPKKHYEAASVHPFWFDPSHTLMVKASFRGLLENGTPIR
jgi:hypothetical protein